PTRNGRIRLVKKQWFSPFAIHRGLRERCLIVWQHDDQIAWSGPINATTPKAGALVPTAPILSKSRCGQNNAVAFASSAHGSFYRDTSIVKVRGKFHDHVTAGKRKEKPEGTSCIVLISRFHDRRYFGLCVNNVLSLEYGECRKRDVLKQDGQREHRSWQLSPRAHRVPKQRRKPTNIEHCYNVETNEGRGARPPTTNNH